MAVAQKGDPLKKQKDTLNFKNNAVQKLMSPKKALKFRARNVPKVFANSIIGVAQKILKGNQRRAGKPSPGSKDYFKIK